MKNFWIEYDEWNDEFVVAARLGFIRAAFWFNVVLLVGVAFGKILEILGG